LPFLLEHLNDENESIRDWAVRGLRDLDTKEARTALWRAGMSATAYDEPSAEDSRNKGGGRSRL